MRIAIVSCENNATTKMVLFNIKCITCIYELLAYLYKVKEAFTYHFKTKTKFCSICQTTL